MKALTNLIAGLRRIQRADGFYPVRAHLDATPAGAKEMADFLSSMQWIPVDERLPPSPDTKVLIAFVHPASSHLLVTEAYWRGGVWGRDDWHYVPKSHVTHWMPMPAPPNSPA